MSKVTYIRAYVESTNAERTEYKPYNTTLTFDHKLAIDVPVPADEVSVEKGVTILSLSGWKAFLKEYTKISEQLNRDYLNQFKP